jgi:hypothetical protein
LEIVSEKKIRRNVSSHKIIKNNYEDEGRREKDLGDNNQPSIPNLNKRREREREKAGQNIESTNKIPPINSREKESNLMDLNLKGINLKLNEKLPFALPKDKKKKPM